MPVQKDNDVKDMAGNLIMSEPLMVGLKAATQGGQMLQDGYDKYVKPALDPNNIHSMMQYYINRMGQARNSFMTQFMPQSPTGQDIAVPPAHPKKVKK